MDIIGKWLTNSKGAHIFLQSAQNFLIVYWITPNEEHAQLTTTILENGKPLPFKSPNTASTECSRTYTLEAPAHINKVSLLKAVVETTAASINADLNCTITLADISLETSRKVRQVRDTLRGE